MAARTLLCISAQSATAIHSRNGVPGACRTFVNDEAGRGEFAGWLDERRGCPVYILVDAVEEDYRTEPLPHASGRARREMVQRRLGQAYRTTPYHAAWLQGRDEDGRRDDRFLFLALTRPQLLTPWLEVIQSAAAPLAGIWLLPQASQQLIDRLKLPARDLLLVSRHPGGLRQSHFCDGKLRMSRLTPAETLDAAIAEIGKTRLYLNSQRLLAHDAGLTLLLADQDGSMADLCARLEAEPGPSCIRLAPDELGARLGVPLPVVAESSHALHLALLGRHAPPASLAPAELTRGYRHSRIGRSLYAAAAAAVLAAAAWSGANLWRQADFDARILRLQAQAGEDRARLAEAARHFPVAPASAENLQKATGTAAAIERGRRTPERLMAAAGRALDRMPEVALNRLRWKFGPDEAGESAGTPGPWRETGWLEGEVGGSDRSAMAGVERFAAMLAADPALAEVDVVQMPLELHPAGNAPGAASARFSLRLVLKEGG